ncbi:hypothetical protein EV121DRAFT_294432 [Schizophyllum commune]
MSRLNVTWANLRVLRAGLDVRQEDLNVLRECVRLEELSFSAWDQGEYFGPQPISLPALHTLEIGHGALGLCSQLDVLSLRHFCLNFACNRLCKRPYEVRSRIRLVGAPAVRALFKGPQNWLEVIFIIDRPTTQRRESSFLHSFVNEFLYDPTLLLYLEELHIVNRSWTCVAYSRRGARPQCCMAELEESWANMRRTDGERILEVSTRE